MAISITGTVKRATDKAVLLDFMYDDLSYEEWFPLSQISVADDVDPADYINDDITITISDWLANEKGFGEVST